MNISSILITLVGILIILALYVIGRLNQKSVPRNTPKILPKIVNDDGNLVSSVLDDIPATEAPKSQGNESETTTEIESENSSKQLILFISEKDESGLDGSLLKQTLFEEGLSLGQNDIYYFHLENGKELFKVANGVEPWTLKDEDIQDQRLVGISLIMQFSSKTQSKESISTYLEKTRSIAEKVDGQIKNQQQQLINTNDLEDIYALNQ